MDIDKILPTNDVMFKIIFGNQKNSRILIHFLNSVIQTKSPIAQVHINQTELSRDLVAQKGVRLDILATTSDGTQINVEMQKNVDPNMISRALFYWAKVYSDAMDSSENYSILKRTISINILDFILLKDEENFWNKYIITNAKNHRQLTDVFEMHFIELRKLENIDKNNPLTFWGEFFKDPNSEQVRKLCNTVPEIQEAKDVFEKAKTSSDARELLRIREKAKLDYASDIKTAKDEGREEERRKNALAMKAEGFDNAVIARCLKISEAEVAKLLNE